jgi:glycosyltransferase involved in cell wall biosynthesis
MDTNQPRTWTLHAGHTLPHLDPQQPPTLSVVIPVYNEAEALPTLLARLDGVLQRLRVSSEVLLVDDGSTDATWSLITRHCQARQEQPGLTRARWRGLRLSRNFGQQAALWLALQHAAGASVAILDADLQDPPELLEEFLRHWQDGAEVVYAVRRKRKEAWPKRLAYFLYYRLLGALAEVVIPPDAGDFCLMDRRVVQAILAGNECTPFIRGLRAWAGYRQVGVPYEREARVAGGAKYTLRRLLRLAADGVFGFTTKPLRLASYAGLVCLTISLAGVVLALAGAVPATLAHATLLAVVLLAGVQLVSIGLLGEYVGRIALHVRRRPVALVREYCGSQPTTLS